MISNEVVDKNEVVDTTLGARWVQDSSVPIQALDFLFILAVHRRFLVITTIVSLVMGGILTCLIRSTFTSTAIVLPPQQPQSTASAMISQLGSLAAIGGASSLGLKSTSDMYVGFLKSRTIADEIIASFDLERVYKVDKMVDLRKTLASHTDIELEKDGLIHISVSDHDPNRASELANTYVKLLYKINSTVAVTEAAQRRVFFDQQLEEEKKALSTAEEDLRSTEQKSGMIQLSGQTNEIIRSVSTLRADIASHEVELQGMRTYATDQNPDVVRLQQEIAALKSQMSRLENDQQVHAVSGDITLPAGRVPQDSLEYARKVREVKYHEALYDLLSKQREAARIDEAKSAPIVQLIDRAVPADKKSGPPRVLLTLGIGFVGFAIAIMWILLKNSLLRLQQLPESTARLYRLRQLFRDRVI